MENVIILITDDDADDREFIADAFFNKIKEENLKHFTHGGQLIEYLKAAPFVDHHLILLDLNMPVMNGYETIMELQKSNDLTSIPIIILTTSPSPADQLQCQNLGCKKFITKPISMKDYETIADSILQEYCA